MDKSRYTNGSPLGWTKVLGMPVSIVDPFGCLRVIESWIVEKENRYICVADVNSIVTGVRNKSHREALVNADMVTPDGLPLVWVARAKGVKGISRVCGPDLLPTLCRHSVRHSWKHFFLGGKQDVTQKLIENLCVQMPGLTIVGFHCPPFRKLTEFEDREVVEIINEAEPDIVWVGLGCPKQEMWMLNHIGSLKGVVTIGIGAAFDFHAGNRPRAPRWMRACGLEWLFRIAQEPLRLVPRYLSIVPLFSILALFDIAGCSFRLQTRISRRGS